MQMPCCQHSERLWACKLRLEKSSSLNHLDALGLFQASGHKGKGGQQGKGSDMHKAMRRTWLLRNVVGSS